jgi:hypothetical protein
VSVHCTYDFRLGGRGIFFEKRHSGHDHAARAIAALHGIGTQERFLHRMKPAIALEALNGGDFARADFARRRGAGARRPSVDEYSAGPALSLAAAVFATGQREIVAQHAEQGAISVCVEAAGLAINVKF